MLLWNERSTDISIISNYKLIGYIKSENPNDGLYTYNGLLVISGSNGQKRVPLDPTQLLLRVSVNSSFIIYNVLNHYLNFCFSLW